MPTLFSWNVNGVRAAVRNGLLEFIEREQPDILCIQETKAHFGDLTPAITEPKGYGSLWCSANKRGYSGVATYFRREPLSVSNMGIEEYDSEGRVQVLEYPEFTLINAYFPNSQEERKRLPYKLGFCSSMLELCQALRSKGKNVIVCGDINIAHREIDLARPKTNTESPGYYIEEREIMTRFLEAGYVDAFRHFVPDPGHYTWWSYRAG
ncbi:MAG: exodeoxyribonuclease III, partial [FCB group bacterium]|nr:exodeoxyribonuclease III [FCB group bacterium]